MTVLCKCRCEFVVGGNSKYVRCPDCGQGWTFPNYIRSEPGIEYEPTDDPQRRKTCEKWRAEWMHNP